MRQRQKTVRLAVKEVTLCLEKRKRNRISGNQCLNHSSHYQHLHPNHFPTHLIARIFHQNLASVIFCFIDNQIVYQKNNTFFWLKINFDSQSDTHVAATSDLCKSCSFCATLTKSSSHDKVKPSNKWSKSTLAFNS